MFKPEYQDYKCTFCKQYFNPPVLVPHLLPCSHSVCNICLQKHISARQSSVICPEDLQTNSISSIRINTTAKKALQRLLKQHKNFNQNNQFLCIQTLSKNLQSLLSEKQSQKDDFLELIDKIFKTEIKRLMKLHQNLKQQLDSPSKMVQQWKKSLKEYLQSLKTVDRKRKSMQIEQELNYYIQEGRRIKQQLNFYNQINFEQLANTVLVSPQICLSNEFSVKELVNQNHSTHEQYQNIHNQQKSIDFVLTQMQSKVSQKPQRKQKERSSNIKESKYRNQNSNRKGDQYKSKNNFQRAQINKIESLFTNQQKSENEGTMHITKDSKAKQSNNNCSNKKILQQLKAPYQRNNKDRTLKQLIFNQNINQACSHEQSCKNSKYLSAYHRLNRDQNVKSQFQNQDEDDQLLINQKQVPQVRNVPEFNFLQQWKIQEQNPLVSSFKIKDRKPFDLEEQKNNYIRKMQMIKVEQALKRTQLIENHTTQLINHSIEDLNFKLFLSKLNWNNLEVLKFVKTNMSDLQINDLLNYMVQSQVTTLVLSGNSLTELSLDAISNFSKINQHLRNIYLSKNNINYLKGQARSKIQNLRQNGLNIYI